MRHYFQTDRSTELLNVENKRRAQRLGTIGLLVSSTSRRISLQRASMGRKITLQNPQNIACVSPLKRESSLMQIHTGLLSIVGFVSWLAAAQAASSFDGTYQGSSATTVNKTFMSPGADTMGQCPDRKPGPFTVASGMARYTTETGATLSGQVSPNGQFEMRVVQGGGSGPLK